MKITSVEVAETENEILDINLWDFKSQKDTVF